MDINNLQSLDEQREFFRGIGTDIIPTGIFERFPELIPCVGVNYERVDGKHKKLLFIGESNYFPAELGSLVKKIERDGDKTFLPLSPEEIQSLEDFIKVFPDENKWYKDDIGKPIPESINTFVSNDTGYPPFVKVFKQANTFLENNGVKPAGDRLTEIAFYNYFLRPAVDNGKDKGFKPKPLDREVAGAALCGIIERLEPQVIVFLSKLAFEGFKWYLGWKKLDYDPKKNNFYIRYNGIEIHRVSHPSSRWWNRNNGEHGKARLENILNKWASNE